MEISAIMENLEAENSFLPLRSLFSNNLLDLSLYHFINSHRSSCNDTFLHIALENNNFKDSSLILDQIIHYELRELLLPKFNEIPTNHKSQIDN